MRTLITLALLLLSTNLFAQDEIDKKTYRELLDLTSKMIETMPHDEWTDYNVHDPGITTMEFLCYALSDMGLRGRQYARTEKMCELLRDMSLDDYRP